MNYFDIRRFVFVLSFCFVITANSNAQSPASGLEVAQPNFMEVVIENLSGDAKEIGLIESRIRTRVELRLRQANLSIQERSTGEYLYVKIAVVGSGFNVSLDFQRLVTFNDGEGNNRWVYASTWHTGGTGTHGDSSEYTIQGLDQMMDVFLNEYLKAN